MVGKLTGSIVLPVYRSTMQWLRLSAEIYPHIYNMYHLSARKLMFYPVVTGVRVRSNHGRPADQLTKQPGGWSTGKLAQWRPGGSEGPGGPGGPGGLREAFERGRLEAQVGRL